MAAAATRNLHRARCHWGPRRRRPARSEHGPRRRAVAVGPVVRRPGTAPVGVCTAMLLASRRRRGATLGGEALACVVDWGLTPSLGTLLPMRVVGLPRLCDVEPRVWWRLNGETGACSVAERAHSAGFAQASNERCREGSRAAAPDLRGRPDSEQVGGDASSAGRLGSGPVAGPGR